MLRIYVAYVGPWGSQEPLETYEFTLKHVQSDPQINLPQSELLPSCRASWVGILHLQSPHFLRQAQTGTGIVFSRWTCPTQNMSYKFPYNLRYICRNPYVVCACYAKILV